VRLPNPIRATRRPHLGLLSADALTLRQVDSGGATRLAARNLHQDSILSLLAMDGATTLDIALLRRSFQASWYVVVSQFSSFESGPPLAHLVEHAESLRPIARTLERVVLRDSEDQSLH
jgi:hypothetical protein